MQPHRGRPKKRELVVTEPQRSQLQQLARQSRSRRSVAFRARILLSCANGVSNAAVARKLRTTGFTVGFWRNRFMAEGVAGLGDEPRPGAPRQIGNEAIAQVVRLTLEKTPKGATHWSTRMLGGPDRVQPVEHQPYLAGFWTEAAPQRKFPALGRPPAD